MNSSAQQSLAFIGDELGIETINKLINTSGMRQKSGVYCPPISSRRRVGLMLRKPKNVTFDRKND